MHVLFYIYIYGEKSIMTAHLGELGSQCGFALEDLHHPAPLK
jgi:hypothetical protein